MFPLNNHFQEVLAPVDDNCCWVWGFNNLRRKFLNEGELATAVTSHGVLVLGEFHWLWSQGWQELPLPSYMLEECCSGSLLDPGTREYSTPGIHIWESGKLTFLVLQSLCGGGSRQPSYLPSICKDSFNYRDENVSWPPLGGVTGQVS